MCQPAPSTPRCSRPIECKRRPWTPKTFATVPSTRRGTLLGDHAHPNGSTASTLCVSNAWTSLIWHRSPRGRMPIHAELITWVVCDPSSPLLHTSTFGLTQPKSLPQAYLGQDRNSSVGDNIRRHVRIRRYTHNDTTVHLDGCHVRTVLNTTCAFTTAFSLPNVP